jgi:ring-1,2-phenylacetyl-CoA epoxidase subunit PaaD
MAVKENIYIDEELYPILKKVTDPEIPVISIIDLGVLREAKLDGNIAKVKITPTYSGCPAMDIIGQDVDTALRKDGYEPEVKQILDPPWTTDWITEEGKQALKDYGIAPPMEATANKRALMGKKHIVKCTHCGSTNTKMVSQFGSTACKAHFKCLDCGDPFDYFKCLV